MLNLAVLALAAASATPQADLKSSASWWEKITVTIAGDGNPQACVYQSSLSGGVSSGCEVDGKSAASASSSGSAQDEHTKITFERRFSPDAPTAAKLQPGDTLVAGHVLAIAIDEAGKVQGCKVVAKSGNQSPDYGCDEVVAEKFEASARSGVETPARQGFLTVMVYGHSEKVV